MDPKTCQRFQTYLQNETFYANLTHSAGQIDDIYLVHGTSLDYDITAHSGNLTTTNGQLLVLVSRTAYHYYTFGLDPYDSDAVFVMNFSIVADNRPMKTKLSMRVNDTSYYFFTCKVPENSMFSFNASSDVVFYNYSDYSDKLVILTPFASQTFYLSLAMNESILILGYVHPSATGSHSSVTITASFSRLLPSTTLTNCYCCHWYSLCVGDVDVHNHSVKQEPY